MPILLVSLFITLCGLSLASPGAGAAAIAQSATTVGQFQKLELTIPSRGAYANPFDPAQVDITGAFVTPSGRTIRVPGFFFQPYTRSRDADGREVLSAAGSPVFKIRFAWGEAGRYRYEVTVKDASGLRRLGGGTFAVRSAANAGFVRRSASPFYFRLDSGAPYFPIGENVCWPGGGGTYDYDNWMSQLGGHGGNYLRLWLINEWNKLGLERLPASPGDGNGLGRYDQQAAWRIDYILSLGERLGIRALMCIESFNSLDAGGEYGNWKQFPYNQANGGPCAAPPGFFTNADAKRLFQQRLRYLVARWGYSTSVFAWEFWNEVDIVTGYDSASVAGWHREMGRYLRSIDPWAHLITTSYGDTTGDPAVDGLPEMDFVQSHSYGSKDLAGTVNSVDLDKAVRYGKPHYFGEFGADVTGRDNASDPEGIHLHNGLWAAVHSRSAGTAMLWWWDNYVEPSHLYSQFSPIAAYVAGVDWPKEDYSPAPVTVRYAPGQDPGTYASMAIEPPGESWGDDSVCNQSHTCMVGRDGSVSNLELLSRVQHGVVNHLNWHNPVTFEVNYPAAGTFEVLVSGVSGYGGAGLTISLDGARALAADFPDTSPDAHQTMRQYDGSHSINVPAGPHTIVVEDTGADWFNVSYRLTNYLRGPNLRVLALANATSGLVWVQNRDHTWWNHRSGISSQPINPSEITLGGFTPGAYRIEQWDTTTGAVANTVTYTSSDGSVVITTPAGLTTDVAYKIRKQ